MEEQISQGGSEYMYDENNHPDPDFLLNYYLKELPEDEEVRKHLVECQECSKVVRDFQDFPELEPSSEAHRLTPEDLESARRALERRIEEEEEDEVM